MRTHSLLLNPNSDSGSGSSSSGGSALGSGSPPPDWRLSIPEDIRGDAALASFKDVGTLAKSYLHAQKLIGTDKLPKPNEKWTPEQWSSFYTELGRPETPDKYPDSDVKLPEGVELDKDSVASAKKYLHEQGLTAKQAKAVLDYHHNLLSREHAAGLESAKQKSAATVEALKKDWGAATDLNVGLAKAIVQQHGGNDLLQELESSGLGNSPGLIRFLHKIATLTLEDLSKGGGVKSFLPTKEAAAQEMNNLIMDKDFQEALNRSQHPGHKAAVARWTEVVGRT